MTTQANESPRSEIFRTRKHNRYWWYKGVDTDYVPPVFSWLTEAEWAIMDAWFDDTEKKFSSPGEVSIPGISFLSGLIGGNGISAMVQCGHYVGYSTLLLGFLFRRMGKKNCLLSIDIDRMVTDYTQSWVDRAGLNEQVKLVVMSSSDTSLPDLANSYFGAPPALVFIDSSHQFQHTIDELDLWWQALRPGGIVAMHDVSIYAQQFDITQKGGVLPAVRHWADQKGVNCFLMNQFVVDGIVPDTLTYKDGCGIGLMQKPMAAPPGRA